MSLHSMLMKDTAALHRATETSDTSGGIVMSWTTIIAGAYVRVEDAKAQTQRLYAVDNIVVTHTLYTDNASGGKGDRWLTSDSRNLLIQGVRKRRGIGGIETFYSYDCLEVRPGA